MTEREFAADVLARLPYQPNVQQMKVALALARFCARPPEGQPSSERVFILNGYAGTGKTTLIGALVKSLAAVRIPTMLLAPTGRAAKVFAASAGVDAHTIHRKIYRHALPGSSTAYSGAPRENKLRNGVFIVDESSMIGSESETGSNILTDLIQYVYSAEGCRLILMGDTAQLPPVGQTESPAMNPDVLRSYGLKVTRATLTEVARQGAGSGILLNATRIRRALAVPESKPAVPLALTADSVGDVSTVSGEDLPDLIERLFRQDGPEETIMITRSNKTATDFNRAIRATVLDREEELTRGDLLIAAKNNYFWTRKVRGLDFVANGEVLRIEKVLGTEVRYGLRFADVVVELLDRPGITFDTKIILNCLTGTSAALDYPAFQKLYEGAIFDPDYNEASLPMDLRVQNLRNSPYFNALQVKYAYAVTCHKAQGGQWKNVIVDLSYIPPEQVGDEFYRWLYTAVTRARRHLYLIAPPESMLT